MRDTQKQVDPSCLGVRALCHEGPGLEVSGRGLGTARQQASGLAAGSGHRRAVADGCGYVFVAIAVGCRWSVGGSVGRSRRLGLWLGLFAARCGLPKKNTTIHRTASTARNYA